MLSSKNIWNPPPSPKCHFSVGKWETKTTVSCLCRWIRSAKCQQRHKALGILLGLKQCCGTSSLSVMKLNICPCQLHSFISMFTLKNENLWTLKVYQNVPNRFICNRQKLGTFSTTWVLTHTHTATNRQEHGEIKIIYMGRKHGREHSVYSHAWKMQEPSKLSRRGRRNSSIGKILALSAWGLEFSPLCPRKKVECGSM